jgi:hypothetical protein
VVQPVASRYTDYAIPAPVLLLLSDLNKLEKTQMDGKINLEFSVFLFKFTINTEGNGNLLMQWKSPEYGNNRGFDFRNVYRRRTISVIRL